MDQAQRSRLAIMVICAQKDHWKVLLVHKDSIRMLKDKAHAHLVMLDITAHTLGTSPLSPLQTLKSKTALLATSASPLSSMPLFLALQASSRLPPQLMVAIAQTAQPATSAHGKEQTLLFNAQICTTALKVQLSQLLA